jgi:hypothetical protein
MLSHPLLDVTKVRSQRIPGVGTMERADKLKASKAYVAEKIADILLRNYDQNGALLETAGTFTALLEAYRAIEIAEKVGVHFDTVAERAQDAEDYRQGVLRNQE